MDSTAWLRQTPDKPLYPDLLWSRPENRRHAGKLLIAGGSAGNFTAVSSAFNAALKAGIGTTRVILPGSLEKTLSKVFPEAEFATATPSGSFARTGLGPLCDAAAWADGVLLAGDFGKNSETAILLEGFIKKYSGALTLNGDSLDYFYNDPSPILDRPQTTLATEFAQLQRLLSGRLLIKHSMNLAQIVEALAKFSANCPAALVTAHSGQIIVASCGQVSTTPATNIDLITLAAYCSVWNLQQPGKTFESLTTAAFSFVQARSVA
jgi:NAD(P)H-hydrate repair Nnr-like enzyme with NAD(P)H-hydrate dehydratase domain